MLGRLVGNVDAGLLAQLPRPHAGAVHNELALDVAFFGAHAGNGPALDQHIHNRRVLKNLRAFQACAFAQRHRQVDRVDTAVLRGIEPGQQTGHVGQRKQFLDLGRRNFQHLVTVAPLIGADPAMLFEVSLVTRRFDEAYRHEPGRLPGFLFKPAVNLLGYTSNGNRRFRAGAIAGHQARRVPGRAGRQLIPLQQHDVRAAHVGKVVSHGTSNNATADDDDARLLR